MEKRGVKLPSGTVGSVGVKTEGRCKICTHPKRLTLEALMVKQVNRESDDDGKRVTRAYIIGYAAREFGLRLTMENILGHQSKHFRYQESVNRMVGQLDGQSSRLLQVAAATEALGRVDRKALLDEFVVLGMGHIRDNDGATITPDLVLRAIDLQRKEGESGGVPDVWRAAAGAIQVNVNVNGGSSEVKVQEEVVDVDAEESE